MKLVNINDGTWVDPDDVVGVVVYETKVHVEMREQERSFVLEEDTVEAAESKAAAIAKILNDEKERWEKYLMFDSRPPSTPTGRRFDREELG